ncbi:diacylglycerol kinase [Propylenella binzhouense]|uniref:Diacylglycerol kinase n=1 Tax=Propylenella binzhouense TaxID=2555902 RepID=A0A964T3X3_9HYPH|nr:diacylglycerol kinase [Propylenella binzhouense]MYZ47459.1 diacylglycerol kinase [Propylenella binzhouense]
MSTEEIGEPPRSAVFGNGRRPSALPGQGGLGRIVDSALNSARGIRAGLRTEAAIQQEFAIAAILLPLSFVVASSAWTWMALVGSLFFVFVVEFLNTAVERLCNHVTPERHEAIRVTKDLASAAVFFALLTAGLVWIVAALTRFGLLS